MDARATEPRTPYRSVESAPHGGWSFRLLRAPSGRLSLRRMAALYALVLLALPAVAGSAYHLLIASPRYTSEAHFALRSTIDGGGPPQLLESDGPSEPGPETLDTVGDALGGAGSAGSKQDPFIAASYITSRDAVARLDEGGWLRARFADPEIDPLSRLSADASIDELYRHWRRYVVAAVDRRSNTVVLRVSAHRPEHAEEIARRVLAVTERRLNEMTLRQRLDTLELARAELVRAQLRHARALERLRELRRTTAVVDPVLDAETTGATLLALMKERIALASEGAVLRRTAGPDAPALADLQARSDALDEQIEAMRARLTGVGRTGTATAALAALEEIETERSFARTMLGLASSAYDRAAREADAAASFALVFVPPSYPTEPSGPGPLASIAFVVVVGFVAWTFVTTVSAVVMDQIS